MARSVRELTASFVADIGNFVRDTQKVEKSLQGIEKASESAEDSATTLQREWSTAGEKIESSVSEAEREIKDLANTFDRQTDDIRRSIRSVGDEEMDIDRGGKVGDVGREAGDEFVEGFGEAIRGGDPTSVITEVLTQGGMIGAAAGGPALAATGMGIAVGAWIVDGLISKMEEEKEAINASIVTTFDAVREAELSGEAAADALTRGFVSKMDKEQALTEILGVETFYDALGKIQDLAADTGLSVQTIGDALLGNNEAIAVAEDAFTRIHGQYGDQSEALEDIISKGRARNSQLEEEEGRLGIAAALSGDVAENTGKTKDASNNTSVPSWGRAAVTSEQTAKNAQDTKSATNSTKPPSMTIFSDHLYEARLHAEATKRAIDNIPSNKRVTIDVATRGAATGGRDRP